MYFFLRSYINSIWRIWILISRPTLNHCNTPTILRLACQNNRKRLMCMNPGVLVFISAISNTMASTLISVIFDSVCVLPPSYFYYISCSLYWLLLDKFLAPTSCCSWVPTRMSCLRQRISRTMNLMSEDDEYYPIKVINITYTLGWRECCLKLLIPIVGPVDIFWSLLVTSFVTSLCRPLLSDGFRSITLICTLWASLICTGSWIWMLQWPAGFSGLLEIHGLIPGSS